MLYMRTIDEKPCNASAIIDEKSNNNTITNGFTRIKSQLYEMHRLMW